MTSRQHPSARERAIAFRIGDVFPAADPIARWVATLSMATNHMVYLNVRLIEGEDDLPPETDVYYFRLMAAHFIEVAEWLRKTRRDWPEIDGFISSSLPTKARDRYDRIVACASKRHPLNAVLKRSRATLFHYPTMHPGRAAAGQEELAQAMRGAQDIDSSIEGGKDYASFRALFADEIATQFLTRDGTELRAIFEQLREPVFDVVRFTELALLAHLRRYPPTAARSIRR